MLTSEEAKEVVSHVDRVTELTRGELHCLRDMEWLNDQVINAYMHQLNQRSISMNTDHEMTYEETLYRGRPLKTYCWNTFFYANLSGESGTQSQGYDYDRVKRWTLRRSIDIFALDLMCFPIHVSKVHWALGVIDFP